MKKLIVKFTVVIILLLMSCDADMGGFLLSPDRFTDDIVINSIENGSLLTVDDLIPVDIITTRDELVVDEVLLSFFDSNGTLLGKISVPGDTTDILNFPSIEIPDVEPGYYWVTISLIENDESIKDKTVHFFISPEEFILPDVIFYPVEIEPESYTLFDLDFIEEGDFKPYIRWSINNSVLKEGAFEALGGRFLWKTPVYEGVYAIKLEVFPYSPNETMDGYNFVSPYTVVSEVYVSEIDRVRDDELAGDEFIALFHFRGNFKDSGIIASTSRVIGNLYPDVRDGVFGFHFGDNSGLILEGNILPVYKDVLQDFSIIGRISPDMNGSGLIYTAENFNKTFTISLEIDENNTLGTEIRYYNNTFYISADEVLDDTGRFTEFEFSYEITEDGQDFIWLIDGRETNRVTFGDFNFNVSDIERSVIGGSGGFSGIIDEFGIKGRIEQEVFDEPLEEAVIGNILLESEYLLEFNETGKLFVEADSNISLPGLIVQGDKAVLELKWAPSDVGEVGDDQEPGFLLVSLNGTGIFEVDRLGIVTLLLDTENESEIAMPDSETVIFSLIQDSRGLWLFIGGEWINLDTIDNGDGLIVSFRLFNPEKGNESFGISRLFAKSNYSNEFDDTLLLKALSFTEPEDDNETQQDDENATELIAGRDITDRGASSIVEDGSESEVVLISELLELADSEETEVEFLEEDVSDSNETAVKPLVDENSTALDSENDDASAVDEDSEISFSAEPILLDESKESIISDEINATLPIEMLN